MSGRKKRLWKPHQRNSFSVSICQCRKHFCILSWNRGRAGVCGKRYGSFRQLYLYRKTRMKPWISKSGKRFSEIKNICLTWRRICIILPIMNSKCDYWVSVSSLRQKGTAYLRTDRWDKIFWSFRENPECKNRARRFFAPFGRICVFFMVFLFREFYRKNRI